MPPARRLLLSALLCLPILARADSAPATLSAQELHADVDFVLRMLAETHPDPAFSADMAAVSRLADTLRKEAASTQSRDQVWRQLTRFNPLFADAHLAVMDGNWRAATAAHLAGKRGLFPFEVTLDGAGQPVIAARLGGQASEHAGARIVAIDGVSAEAASAALLARVHGDTPAFRRHLLAQRWWYFHWKMYGAPERYRLTLARDGRRWNVEVAAAAAQPAMLRAEADLDGQYRFEARPGCPAVLTVGSFDGANKERLLALTQDAFTRMRAANTGALVIDVSANGGGDDPMWLDGLMPYLATQRYRTGSAWIKRVMEANPERNESAGQVVRGAIETWRAPQPDHPLAFKGKVFVRIGPSTYSSAVLFSNVMRDFGFATLVGDGGAARRAQSGGVRKYVLPHSKLAMYVPRFVLDPPMPAAGAALLEADAPAAPPCAAPAPG